MFGLARFKNEEYTLYLACLGSYALKTKQYTLYLASVWALTLQVRIYIAFEMQCSVCLGLQALGTKNIHCT